MNMDEYEWVWMNMDEHEWVWMNMDEIKALYVNIVLLYIEKRSDGDKLV